jgi:hypothetical protein
MIFGEGEKVYIAMCVCKDQAIINDFGPFIPFSPKTKRPLRSYFHPAHLKQYNGSGNAEKNVRQSHKKSNYPKAIQKAIFWEEFF